MCLMALMMKGPKNEAPGDFTSPIALPADAEQQRRWQDSNRLWWESHPMRYDWKKAVGCEEFSREFFEEIDKRMPWRIWPFYSLIDIAALKNKDVLEIGVGNGSHAQLLAAAARSFTGIDITEYGVRSTSERMKVFGLPGKILRMDAESMGFRDHSFDFIWTWGVIHHSANTRGILKEMRRVLKPSGHAVTMVYHRGLWNYYTVGGIMRGIAGGDLFRTRSLHRTVQRHTDGAIARYYSLSEWRRMASEYFRVGRMRVFGDKTDLVPLPGGRVKDAAMVLIPDRVSRFLTNRCRFGSLLVSSLVKAQ